jgi:hypothetical protein
MLDLPLDIRDELPSIRLVPTPVQLLSSQAELNDEVGGQVLWLDFSALFPPKAEQGRLVIAHDNAGVGAADEVAAINAIPSIC